MNKFFILAIPFLLCSFAGNENAPIDKERYETVKTNVQSQRQKYKVVYQAATLTGKKVVLSEAGKYLHKSLTDTIFSYWYGTKWDFNGYSDKPGEGIIACGYFVSTTLKHCGFNLNRYKLAQEYSLEIVKRISSGDSVLTYRGINAQQFLQKTKGKIQDGLYVIGLDNHVGFLLYEGPEVYFIHSSYFDPVAVVREKASESKAFATSRTFVMCNISSNEKLIKKWILGEEISTR
ncbi:hypothetical protein CHU_3455 [Sporocytophaga myxococcoides]|uniref:NlpC/P60 domain-containing protein n=1 Tax=Sporocytophaga myxococcoides TaxID=153721 RepID=A0A098LKH1_9BACT|nr:hypothetical protein [Sporocytophaga myxococcoides]GAL87491.1 hypothetical protein CHU_3455 [Sporocytophaga myxococcoides]